MDDLFKTMRISGSGMKAQGTRLRVISENIANANSLPTKPGERPYQRKVVLFKNELDRKMETDLVKVEKVRPDRSEFKKRYDPSHPAADETGYVLAPNINTLMETMDMREAQRSYEANMNVIRASKEMLNKSIDLLR